MYYYKKTNLNRNLDYLKLYNNNFKGHFFTLDYINWLYKKNPDGTFFGIDIFHKKKIIGQCGGIPFYLCKNSRKIKSFISINICLDKAHRGKGIMVNAQKKLLKLLKIKKYVFFCALPNYLAIKSWIKSFKLKFYKPLDVRFFIFGIDSLNNYNFNDALKIIWSHKKIRWRLKSPRTKFKLFNYKDNIFIYLKIKFLKIISPIKYKKRKEILKKNFTFMPAIFIGLGFKKFFKTLSFNIPLFLRPAPLFFIYKILNKSVLNDKDIDNVQFTIADFDVY